MQLGVFLIGDVADGVAFFDELREGLKSADIGVGIESSIGLSALWRNSAVALFSYADDVSTKASKGGGDFNSVSIHRVSRYSLNVG